MEFGPLKAFAEHPDRVLSRNHRLDLAHNRGWQPFDRSIDIRIARIRRKIESDPSKPQVSKTVRGAGYILSPFQVCFGLISGLFGGPVTPKPAPNLPAGSLKHVGATLIQTIEPTGLALDGRRFFLHALQRTVT
jgi:hypothetical protein